MKGDVHVPKVDTKPIAWSGAVAVEVIVITEAMMSVLNMYQETETPQWRVGDVAKY